MRSLSVREWEYLPVAGVADPGTATRAEADELIQAARRAQDTLWRSGGDGERVLIDGRHRLRAQQVVGVLVGRNVALEILPKIDGAGDAGKTRRNLVHMLARVLDLRLADDSLAQLDWQRHDLLEILISIFCRKLHAALRMGLPQHYLGCQDDLAVLRGRLDSKRQFTLLAGSPQKLACVFDELSPDIPLNRILKTAVTVLRQVARSPVNCQRLEDFAPYFDQVATIQPGELPWNRVILDRTNVAFHELVRFARLLIASRYQTTSSGGASGFGLVFEMNTLFEEYVGRELQRVLRGTETAVSLQGPQSWALEDRSGSGLFRTRPDIVLMRSGSCQAVLDTKWKRISRSIEDRRQGISQADIYQMMAYAQVYNAPRVGLIYPHHSDLGGTPGVLSRFRVRGSSETSITIATISLDNVATVGAQLSRLCDDILISPELYCFPESSSHMNTGTAQRDGT